MKLNIFRIPPDQQGALKKKLVDKELSSTRELEQDGWKGDFFFCPDPPPGVIPWVKTFSEYLGNQNYYNRSYFAVITLAKADSMYAMAFGKAHFFVRPHCDYDFGIELAKRIADEDDIAQTAARRYQGKQKKEIRSYGGRARLNVPPGNSVDFLKGSVVSDKADVFGTSDKFGTSCLLPTSPPTRSGASYPRLTTNSPRTHASNSPERSSSRTKMRSTDMTRS